MISNRGMILERNRKILHRAWNYESREFLIPINKLSIFLSLQLCRKFNYKEIEPKMRIKNLIETQESREN